MQYEKGQKSMRRVERGGGSGCELDVRVSPGDVWMIIGASVNDHVGYRIWGKTRCTIEYEIKICEKLLAARPDVLVFGCGCVPCIAYPTHARFYRSNTDTFASR